MSISPEEAWDVFTRLQRRMGKKIRLGGSAVLMAWVRPEFHRRIKDFDIILPKSLSCVERQVAARVGTKGIYMDVLCDSFKHPLYIYMHKILSAPVALTAFEKALGDFRRVHKTYEFLRQHRSPEIAEMYLEDLAHAFAKSVEASMQQRERDRFALLFEPDPGETIVRSFRRVASKDPLLADFLKRVLRRSVEYLPDKYKRTITKAWRGILDDR